MMLSLCTVLRRDGLSGRYGVPDAYGRLFISQPVNVSQTPEAQLPGDTLINFVTLAVLPVNGDAGLQSFRDPVRRNHDAAVSERVAYEVIRRFPRWFEAVMRACHRVIECITAAIPSPVQRQELRGYFDYLLRFCCASLASRRC